MDSWRLNAYETPIQIRAKESRVSEPNLIRRLGDFWPVSMVEKKTVLNIFRGTIAGLGCGVIVFAGFVGILSWRVLLVFGAMVFVGLVPTRLFKRKKTEAVIQ
jgi:hypothetical protein